MSMYLTAALNLYQCSASSKSSGLEKTGSRVVYDSFFGPWQTDDPPDDEISGLLLPDPGTGSSRAPPARRFVVGRYELRERLAQGGQAIVHRAWDPQLQREVVLKVSRRPLGSGTASCCRTAQEGAILAQLDDPHIVRVLDFGMHHGYPYLVLERICGTTLREAFAHRPASTSEARQILTQVATAVAAAHRNGILHLDLKPENVMIDSQGTCTLIDFGMSWLLNKKQGPRLTFAVGTRNYMAPEQRQGETELWCPATDVFGLGCLLHFLKTGSPPGSEPFSPKDGMFPIRESVPLPFLQRSLTNIGRKALSPEIENRYGDAAEFLQALRWW